MASSTSAVQRILSLPTTTRVGQITKGGAYLLPAFQLQQRGLTTSRHMQVRCMSEGDKLPKQPTPPSPAAKKLSTSFWDILAFSGPAPERINGRLAMIGFVTAIGVELAKGDDLVAQLGDGGVPWFLYTSVLLTLASLVPMFSGVSAESKSKGLMTSDAELLNGRAAMLGLLALVVTELVKGGALV